MLHLISKAEADLDRLLTSPRVGITCIGYGQGYVETEITNPKQESIKKALSGKNYFFKICGTIKVVNSEEAFYIEPDQKRIRIYASELAGKSLIKILES